MIKFARTIMHGITVKIRKLHIHNKNVELFFNFIYSYFCKILWNKIIKAVREE